MANVNRLRNLGVVLNERAFVTFKRYGIQLIGSKVIPYSARRLGKLNGLLYLELLGTQGGHHGFIPIHEAELDELVRYLQEAIAEYRQLREQGD